MSSENFPIFKLALELCIYVETRVKGFDKYHKYTIGEDMRKFSRELPFLLSKINMDKDERQELIKLRDKMLIMLSKEFKAHKSFLCSTE